MNRFRCLAFVLVAALLRAQQSTPQPAPPAPPASSQFSPEVTIESPKRVPFIQPLLDPFHVQARPVAPAKLTNSPRLESLVSGGNLYLSVDDVIALTLENNLDIAIQRYGPYLAREVLRRSEGGAPLRSVGIPIAAGPVSVSTAGVTASAVGVAGGGSGVSTGGGVVTSTGTQPPALDPSVFFAAQFQHTTTPLSNTNLSFVEAQVNSNRILNFGYTQSWTTGTTATLQFLSYRTEVNSQAYVLNPYTTGYIDLYITQPILQGWGRPVNDRFIRVAKNNVKVNDYNFRLQVITTVSAVLNLYWDLVSFDEDLRIKQKALETAEQLFEDNKRQAELGTLPQIEVTRAQAQVSQSKEDLLIAQTNVAQQETVLKNALSRTGIANNWLDDVHIIPLDHIVVPAKEVLPPTPELIEEAIENRPEIAYTKINVESTKVLLSGSKNALLPTLNAFTELTNNGLTGSPNVLGSFLGLPSPYLVGNYGNLLSQIFRRNYPNYSAGFQLNIPFRNRAPQADYVQDQLNVRQGELQLQKAINQVRVDVKNAIVSLQQARARYETAVATRLLQQQTLDAEQMRFKFGESSIATVVQAQRDLATDQTAEVESMANYTHAKIAFEQAVGRTLDVNHISIEEAESGRVARQSSLPEAAAKSGGER
jgi:outer membrane protein TolC